MLPLLGALYPEIEHVARRLQSILDDLNDRAAVIRHLFCAVGPERSIADVAAWTGLSPARVARIEQDIGRLLRKKKREEAARGSDPPPS
jgi:hypothetical protein